MMFRKFPVMILCVFLGCAVSADQTAPWEELLAQANVKMQDTKIYGSRFYDMGRFTRSTFRKVWEDWTLLDSVTLAAGKKFLAASGNCRNLLSTAAEYNDSSSEVGSFEHPVASADENAKTRLFESIRAICCNSGEPLAPERQNELKRKIDALPPVAASCAAAILKEVPEANRLRDESLKNVAGPEMYGELFHQTVDLCNAYRVTDLTRKLLEKGDMVPLTAGALKLAGAVDAVVESGKTLKAEGEFSFSFDTPMGRIVLNGTRNDKYEDADYLLILDFGGDDVYSGGATTLREKCPVSVLVDFGGNDRYESKDNRFGVGILGYGILVDCGGKDVYNSNHGVGYCAWGTGLVVDLGDDDDSCTVNAYGPASGVLGLAVVNDCGGNDHYWCRWQGMSSARVGACTALVDVSGDDTYEADDKEIKYPSPQTKEHNTNLSLGCSYGRRAHPGDGYSLAGGVAIVVDGAGNDSYSSGVFGQGSGYWFGLGMLVDFSGNDKRTGAYYSQGAAAHYAAGSLLDLGGDDSYLLLLHQGQGHGRDYSIGLLHDVGGTDVYKSQGSSIGQMHFNGIGLFWKEGGDADFQCPGDTPGSTFRDTRPNEIGLGLFRAQGGKFTFRPDNCAGPGRSWVRPFDPKHPKSYGIGKAD